SRGKSTPRKVLVPVVATVVMAYFSYRLENMTDWRLTIFGLMTLFVVYYLQDGIVGFFRSLLGRGAVHDKSLAVAAGQTDAFAGVAAGVAAGSAAGSALLQVEQVLMQ